MYRQEHPKPQFERKNWQNLNGEWQFEIDQSMSGEERGLFNENETFPKKINVPFCPESILSGIGNIDFMNSVWYKRDFKITKEQASELIFLHFGAVDYETIVYVNGKKCGYHKGGFASFRINITDFVRTGNNILTIWAKDPMRIGSSNFTANEDDMRNRMIPRGKQCDKYHSYGCLYTRVTGIWQTVWLEFVPKTHLEKVKYYPEIDTASLTVTATLCGTATLKAQAFYEGRLMGETSITCQSGTVTFNISLKEKHLWELGAGRLYDLKFTYGEDEVKSYFGLRQIGLDNHKFLLNGKSVFQRLVLDQGYYPDGVYTAPNDKSLEADILRGLEMGFNGARLHEKVFEERFLYYCDKHGYMVWGEYGNWGVNFSYSDCIYSILPEWIEVLERDFNHPSIVVWCPLNETWDKNGRKQFDPALTLLYDTTKAIDPTRPCIDTSGFYHVKTDIFDVHNYEEYEKFAHRYDELMKNGTYEDELSSRQPFTKGTPFIVSEYGGVGWTDDENSFVYNKIPKTEEEYLSVLKRTTEYLLNNQFICGFCFTQLYDIEQEQNGLFTYERVPKFPAEKIRPIFMKKANIEDV